MVAESDKRLMVEESDKVFTGSVPEVYDRYLVPLIFEYYANDLATRVAALRPAAVLETAAGTGVVTRALAVQLGPEVRLIATDLNQPMLDQAAARQTGGSAVVWRQADALALPFDDRAFDVVVCQFGAMFFPDKVQGYREALRVLKPGGTFMFNVWDSIAENAFADVVTDALATVFPDDPPRFMARTPHGYHDAVRIREELDTAGFASVSVETIGHASRAGSARDVAIAYCQGTPLRNEIVTRDSSLLEEATQRATDVLIRRFGDGAIEGPIKAHVFTAVR